YAWVKKLKSTYYCFIDKVLKGEKYTEKVNKRGSRKGFGASESSGDNGASKKTGPVDENKAELEARARGKFGDEVVEEALEADADSCPTDPMLRRICPACEEKLSLPNIALIAIHILALKSQLIKKHCKAFQFLLYILKSFAPEQLLFSPNKRKA